MSRFDAGPRGRQSGMQIGVISDTHGLVRQSALDALSGSDLIVHAGDVGKPGVIEALEELAPVVAVRGNVDRGDWARGLPQSEVVSAGDRHLYLIHDIAELDIDPTAGFDGVVYGHSHKPVNEWRGDILYFNPGSAGPRRFKLPIALGWIRVSSSGVRAGIVELEN